MGLMTDYKSESKYLKADDLASHNWEWTLTITGVSETEFNDGNKQPALSFKETKKILGLNKTNRTTLCEMFGKPNDQGLMDVEADELIGKVITVFKSRTQNSGGTQVDCVRLRFPRVAAYNVATASAASVAPSVPAEQFTAEQQAAASVALMWLDGLNMQGLTKADADAAKAHGAAIGANLAGVTTLKGGIDAVRKRATQIAETLTISKTEDIPF